MKRIAQVCVIGLALAFALGSGVYTASKLNGKSIKVASVPGDRVKPDSLSGAQVNEAQLGIVPSAQTARRAQARRAPRSRRAPRRRRAQRARSRSPASFNSGLVHASVGEDPELARFGPHRRAARFVPQRDVACRSATG